MERIFSVLTQVLVAVDAIDGKTKVISSNNEVIMRRLGDDEPREPHGRAFVNKQLLIEAGSLCE